MNRLSYLEKDGLVRGVRVFLEFEDFAARSKFKRIPAAERTYDKHTHSWIVEFPFKPIVHSVIHHLVNTTAFGIDSLSLKQAANRSPDIPFSTIRPSSDEIGYQLDFQNGRLLAAFPYDKPLIDAIEETPLFGRKTFDHPQLGWVHEFVPMRVYVRMLLLFRDQFEVTPAAASVLDQFASTGEGEGEIYFNLHFTLAPSYATVQIEPVGKPRTPFNTAAIDNKIDDVTTGYYLDWRGANYRSSKQPKSVPVNLKRQGAIPTGSALILMDWAETQDSLSVSVEDNNLELSYDLRRGVSNLDLREYQNEALQVGLDVGRGIFDMATNAGKTEIMFSLIEAYGIPRTTIVVPTQDLLIQVLKRARAIWGDRVGAVGAGYNAPGHITVAVGRSYSDKAHLFKKEQLLMLDECDRFTSPNFYDRIMDSPAYHRFGFSGTPWKNDKHRDLMLRAMIGPALKVVTNQELIELGYSSPVQVEIHRYANDDIHLRGADAETYAAAYKALIVQHQDRNEKIAELARERDEGVVLIIVRHEEHGLLLQELIPESSFVNFRSSIGERQAVLEEMRKDRPGIYIASTIFDLGIDVANIHTLIMAAGNKNSRATLQRLGRILRKKTKEPYQATLYDFMDLGRPYIYRHSLRRLNDYVREGIPVRYC